MAPLTRKDLDGQHCMAPGGCTHDHGDGLVLVAACHPRAALAVMYRAGVLIVRCARCTQLVTEVAVADEATH